MGIIYAGDFEATTKKENCHVWAWSLCEVGNAENLYIGTDIYEYMNLLEDDPENPKVYMHGLKYDGQFIISWLFENGFTHVTNSKDRETKTFKTMISDKGLYYSIEVIFYKKGKNIKKVTFFDSLKLFPDMSIADIAKAFHMPIQKLEIDYTAHDDLPYGSPITAKEQEYIIADVRILANALSEFFAMGMDKITIGSCAMSEYKKIVGQRNFKRWFPSLPMHDDVKQCYKGGWCYYNPVFAGVEVSNGMALDENSLFPAMMKEKELPWGSPIFYEGKYKPDPVYSLYIQMIRCAFEIKPGKVPTVQLNGAGSYMGGDYQTSSNDEEVVLCLTNVDLELFLEQYETFNLKYISGWKFRGQVGMFDEYIEKWGSLKIKAAEEGNWSLYLLCKLMLNSLYGKFGTSTTRRAKIPYMGEDGVVKYRDTSPITQEGVYVPLAAFVTSYGRDTTIRAVQKIVDDYTAGRSQNQFLYSDTDSIHILSPEGEIPEGLEIDRFKLGAWKIEAVFDRAKVLRRKCYIETHIISEAKYKEGMESDEAYLYSQDGEQYKYMKITVAGLPSDRYKQVNYENFMIGAEYSGKKVPRNVPGGVVLETETFTIRR